MLKIPGLPRCIFTYVLTMFEQEREEELEHELEQAKFKWEIIGLSEMRRRGKQWSSCRVDMCCTPEEPIGGVGFMVNKSIKDRVVQYKGINSRVASITIKINKKYKIQVVQVYSSTSSHSDDEVEELYEEITKIMQRNKSHYKIIMGDFH